MDPYVIRKVIGANHFADLMDQAKEIVVSMMMIAALDALFVLMAPAQTDVLMELVIAVVTIMVSGFVVQSMELESA